MYNRPLQAFIKKRPVFREINRNTNKYIVFVKKKKKKNYFSLGHGTERFILYIAKYFVSSSFWNYPNSSFDSQIGKTRIYYCVLYLLGDS